MTDYYTPTVVDPMIPLAAMLPIERLFLSQVFSEEAGEEAAYYFSEEGPSDLIFLDAAEVRAALAVAQPEGSSLVRILLEGHGDAISAGDEIELDGCWDLWAGVFQDIVRRSADLDHLTVTKAFTCSKMRADGFGGLAMPITAAAIRSESTNTLFDRFYTEAQANEEIGPGNL